MGRGERGGGARARCPPTSSSRNHVLLGGPVGAATGAPLRRQGARLRARVRDAGPPRLGAWGAEALDRRAGDVRRARPTSGRCSPTSAGPSRASTRCRPGSTSTSGMPEERDAALAALIDEARRDPPNPGNAEERLPDEGNAARLAAFLAGDLPTVVYFGKLIEQKGVHVLLDALRGLDARAVVVGFGPERAALESLAAVVRRPGALHRAARAPAPAPPARARRRVRRAVRVPRGVRDGRGRGGGRRVPACRLAPLRARGGRSGARGRAVRPRSRRSSRSRPATQPRSASG